MEKKKSFVVGDQYRKNELAFEPGGYDVTIQYFDGRADKIYPNVHKFKGYAMTIFKGPDKFSIKQLIYHHPDGIQTMTLEQCFGNTSTKSKSEVRNSK